MIRSHFVHAYIIVQVEHPKTDHTVYKVAVGAKDEVPDFGPPLPDPAIFQKGAEFRDWLLMKVLNAEFNCHQASSFKKLAVSIKMCGTCDSE
jgi:RAP1 GTPase activating protein 1